MANISIREFDAKNLFFKSIKETYSGSKIKQIGDFENIDSNKKYVIKPDHLFGKRGKLGLVGVNLSLKESKDWFLGRVGKEFTLNNITGTLDTFLLEEFIPHDKEYYFAVKQEREYDEIFFSDFGGIDVEENWDKVKSFKLGVLEEIENIDLKNNFGIIDKKIEKVIFNLIKFYRENDFTYLEVNPFCFDLRNGDLVLLDMVAKIDDSAFFLHPRTWENLEIPSSFGYKENVRESYIKELDQKTGASLKLKFLNTNGKIWTLLSGGGGSLVITDTLGYLGYSQEIANYGELSGDPDRYFTREYTRVLFEQMLESGNAKYLIIAGAIANFTQIDKTFTGIIDVLKEKHEELKKQSIKILVRRGGINDKKGIELLKNACEELGLDCLLADSNTYMTDILKEIKL